MKYVALTGLLLCWATAQASLPFTHPVFINISPKHLENIDRVVKNGIQSNEFAGAVVLAAQQEKIFYRQAFGTQAFAQPSPRLTLDSIFNLGRLKQCVAVIPSIFLLAERGYCHLAEPVCKYLPEFSYDGPESPNISDLLDDYPLSSVRDESFATLAKLVQAISGSPLELFAQTNIFSKLGMNNTFFVPEEKHRDRIVNTVNNVSSEAVDARTQSDLYSTAPDLALFCQMILNDGMHGNVRILSQASVNILYSMVQQSLQDYYLAKSYRITHPTGDFSPLSACITNGTGSIILIDKNAQSILVFLSAANSENNIGNIQSYIANIVTSGIGKIKVV